MINNKQKESLIEIALVAARQETDEITRSYLLKEIAIQLSENERFKEATYLCKEIIYPDYIHEALLEISLNMLLYGDKEGALIAINTVLKMCQDSEEGFPEGAFLKYLDHYSLVGFETLVRSILTFALARVEQMEPSGFQLHCYLKILKALINNWREKAEEVVDNILNLPLTEMSSEEGFIKSAPSELCELALMVRKYGLGWNDTRQELFMNHLQPGSSTI